MGHVSASRPASLGGSAGRDDAGRAFATA